MIKRAIEKAHVKMFTPYDLRDFLASWLRFHGVPDWIINIIQGRTSEEDINTIKTLASQVWETHYIKPITSITDFLEWIRDTWYDSNIYCVLCE